MKETVALVVLDVLNIVGNGAYYYDDSERKSITGGVYNTITLVLSISMHRDTVFHSKELHSNLNVLNRKYV